VGNDGNAPRLRYHGTRRPLGAFKRAGNFGKYRKILKWYRSIGTYAEHPRLKMAESFCFS
jgi:hypothetical protein